MEDVNEVRAFLIRELGGKDEGNIFAPPWAPGEMGTDDGYVITTETNGVFLDAMVGDAEVLLSIINVQRQGVGFGTTVMEALAKFAKERDLAIQVYSVLNPAFFDTIKWLNKYYRSKFGPPDPYLDDEDDDAS